MKEKETKKDEVIEIDFKRLLDAVVRKAWLVGIVAVLCAVLTFLGTFLFVTPLYESSAIFYVNNNALSVGDASFSLSTGDISAAKSLVDSYIVILKTRTTLNDVIDYAGVDRSYGELKGMISAAMTPWRQKKSQMPLPISCPKEFPASSKALLQRSWIPLLLQVSPVLPAIRSIP